MAVATSKMIGTLAISKFLWKIYERLLKISAPYSKSSFQKFEKTLYVRGLKRMRNLPRNGVEIQLRVSNSKRVDNHVI